MLCSLLTHTFTTQYQYAGTTAKLRLYYTKTFIGSSQESVVGAAVGSAGWFDEIDLTVVDNQLVMPAFDLVVTVNGTPPTSRIFGVLYSEDGVRRENLLGDDRGWFIPAVASISFPALQIANRAVAIFEPLREYLTAADMIAATMALIASTAPGAHAATHQNGGADEISVVGLSGLLADQQTPAAHVTRHQNGGNDELSVTGLSGLLADGQTPLAHASSHISGGGDPFTSAQLLEAIVKRIQTSTGPTTLTVGALADGEFLKRDGAAIVSAVPAGTGIGGSTGATDNAALRADGTGGATVQASNLTIPDDAATTEVGYLNIPQNSQSADYAAVIADRGKHIYHPTTDDNPRTFTIPANSSVAYAIGTAITFVNDQNTLTIAITSDTLVWAQDGTTGSRTLAENGMATAIKVTSTRWIISGTGLS